MVGKIIKWQITFLASRCTKQLIMSLEQEGDRSFMVLDICAESVSFSKVKLKTMWKFVTGI